jgi:hypothetical protein
MLQTLFHYQATFQDKLPEERRNQVIYQTNILQKNWNVKIETNS